jgi:hypothetical protein
VLVFIAAGLVRPSSDGRRMLQWVAAGFGELNPVHLAFYFLTFAMGNS